MAAYYNEFDPYAAQWLRNLISAGHIAEGEVDDRSITDVEPSDLEGFTQCHFFAGIGGWSLALRYAGWPDDRPVWTGSLPCQPFSAAGSQRGAADERHLWPVYFRLIAQHRPAALFGEQVAPAIGNGWLDAVFADMEGEGYACAAAVLPACSVGAPHLRQRLWFVADSASAGLEGTAGASVQKRSDGLASSGGGEFLADTGGNEQRGVSSVKRRQISSAGDSRQVDWTELEWLPCADGKARPTQPGIFPLVNGLPEGLDYSRTGTLKAAGNAIVPQVAAEFIASTGL